MVHAASIKVQYPVSAARLFDALTNLGSYPLWNSGMVSISESGQMREGMEYETVSIVMGQQNHSVVTVEKLVDAQLIELSGATGIVTFDASIRINEVQTNMTELTCDLEFDMPGLALKFAAPVLQTMAKTRMQGDFETLKAVLAEPTVV